MKFENIIKRISAIAAACVVFMVAAGMYLSFKGFVMGQNGSITLVKNAYAVEQPAVAPKMIPNNVVLPSGEILGNKDAPITIYEFSSFGCYHCADFHLKTLPLLEKEFISKGQLKIVFSDFPLDAKSMQASLMSHCFKGSKYFRFINTLFQKQREWGMSNQTGDLLKQYAFANGLNQDVATRCLENKLKAQDIMESRQYAVNHLGITGTPSFVISGSQGSQILYGAPDYETLKAIIEKNITTK